MEHFGIKNPQRSRIVDVVEFVVAPGSALTPTTLLTQRRGAGGVGVAELEWATGFAATSTPPTATSMMSLATRDPTTRRSGGVAGVAQNVLNTSLRRQTLATPEKRIGGGGAKEQGRSVMWMDAGLRGT